MGITETSERDNETREPSGATADRSQSEESAHARRVIDEGGANEEGTKSSTGKRFWTITIIIVVVAIVIFGVVFSFVREESRREEKPSSFKNDDLHYPTWNDESYGILDQDENITEYPFEIESSLFASDVRGSYASIEELKIDIEALAKSFANTIILEQENYNANSWLEKGAIATNVAPAFDAEMAFDESGPSLESSSESFKGVDDFETYQHEAGVVKNDLVKSNGVHVFAASGNRIRVWDLEGNLSETTRISSTGNDKTAVNIVAMLMNPDGDLLTVISSDYGKYFYYNEVMSIINNSRETQVTTFKVEGSTLTEIQQAYIDGYHVESYSVGNNVHIVTRMMLNTWAYFDDPLMRYNFDDVMTNEEYVAEATQIAEKIIPDFVDKVIDLVTEGDEIILSPLVGFPNSASHYKTISQVYSFDTSKIGEEDDIQFDASKSLVLTPGYTGHVYATNKWIWVADENSAWDFERQDYVQQTMLLGFRLEGASSNFAALGTIPGQILSQFSIDFVEEDDNEYVRVAITQNFFRNFFWGPRPMPMSLQEERDFEDEEILDETEESRTLNEIVILEIPQTSSESQEMNELVKVGSLEVGKIHEASPLYKK